MEICFATNNQHKLEEVRHILSPDFLILSLAEIGCNADLPETRDTFEGNASQKAEYVFNHYAIPCFADDSGLVVNALNGEPGIFSARYAGQQRSDDDNIALVLKNLTNIADRSAQFKTVIAFIDNKKTQLFEGSIAGSIVKEKTGNNGFGYDPIFMPDGHDKTFAELSAAQKNAMSHRSVAVTKLASFLKTYSIS